ncbi:MAG: polyprenyl synthetase family protein [Deltaproteobacteria bacterium]|nr:polyprenyl synthetase family protein [Deltaproteobacteria bacterium]
MAGFLEEDKAQVDRALEGVMPPKGTYPSRLVDAMRYSLFAGGKRIRPILVLSSARAAGGDPENAMAAACAVELVHTYSLIHDDLPAMDDDDYRRGKPTCHRAFDEGTAILAGDALLTMAFELLCDPELLQSVQPVDRLRMIRKLGAAAGWKGMVGGQQVDLDSEGKPPSQPVLEYIHTHKTGAMIRCSVLLGALAAGAGDAVSRALGQYGENLGLAFQVVDDILDVTASTNEMGKDHGSDAASGKVTYPALFGLEGAKDRARGLIAEAKSHLEGMADDGHLAEIADFVLLRRL